MITTTSLLWPSKYACRLTGSLGLARQHSVPFAITKRLLSSVSDVVGRDNEKKISDNDNGGKISRMQLFPWRHESSPLPRLIPGTPEHASEGLLLTSNSQRVYGSSSLNAIVTAYMFLNVPWYELFWISHFQDELTSDMSWSFTQAVGNLLSKLSSFGGGDPIPTGRIIKESEDGTCCLEFIETFEIDRHEDTYRINVVSDERHSADTNGNAVSNGNETLPLQRIFEEKVLNLYQASIDKILEPATDTIEDVMSNKHKLEVCLKMKPCNAEFITLYAIPYLSRGNAKSDPELLKFYGEMLNSPSRGRATYLSHLRREHLENRGHMESTIIAQCLVWCDEEFYIEDLSTGKILQGTKSKQGSHRGPSQIRKIPHLVRMERTVVTKRDSLTGNFENDQGNWVITDIDDLLGGNLLV